MGKPRYWAVGHDFDGEDKTKEFLNNGYWYDGYSENDDYRYSDVLKQININDILCLKSSSTKGPREKGKAITFTRLKNIGIVTDKESEYCFNVDWLPKEKEKNDFDKIAYRTTIEELRNDKLLMYVKNKIQIYQGEKEMEEYISLIESNKNVIFTGAPGTGKTYLAQKMSEKIVGHDNKLSNIAFVQFHPSYDYTDFVEGLRPFDKGEMQIGFKLENGIFKKFCKDAAGKKEEKFVFIIDEINRGEISKIFGELFFSVDPDYRGKKGIVKTQYSNMIPKDDFFKEGFYIPENVYIIGTMNDIDRSVESLDFAMRRRFTWIEIKASDTAEKMFQKEIPEYENEALDRLYSLNEAISNADAETLLNESYHIGGAYFLKLKEYKGDYNKLWEYHLLPLLREYLRGTQDIGYIDRNLKIFRNAYDLVPTENKSENNAEDEG